MFRLGPTGYLHSLLQWSSALNHNLYSSGPLFPSLFGMGQFEAPMHHSAALFPAEPTIATQNSELEPVPGNSSPVDEPLDLSQKKAQPMSEPRKPDVFRPASSSGVESFLSNNGFSTTLRLVYIHHHSPRVRLSFLTLLSSLFIWDIMPTGANVNVTGTFLDSISV